MNSTVITTSTCWALFWSWPCLSAEAWAGWAQALVTAAGIAVAAYFVIAQIRANGELQANAANQVLQAKIGRLLVHADRIVSNAEDDVIRFVEEREWYAVVEFQPTLLTQEEASRLDWKNRVIEEDLQSLTSLPQAELPKEIVKWIEIFTRSVMDFQRSGELARYFSATEPVNAASHEKAMKEISEELLRMLDVLEAAAGLPVMARRKAGTWARHDGLRSALRAPR